MKLFPMKIHVIFFILLILIPNSLISASESHSINLQKSIMIPMRDGTLLSTDLYFPKNSNDKLPTVLIRTVYNKQGTLDWNKTYSKLVENGYVVAIQDIRGRYESQGNYIVAHKRREDGNDTLNSNSDGRYQPPQSHHRHSHVSSLWLLSSRPRLASF